MCIFHDWVYIGHQESIDVCVKCGKMRISYCSGGIDDGEKHDVLLATEKQMATYYQEALQIRTQRANRAKERKIAEERLKKFMQKLRKVTMTEVIQKCMVCLLPIQEDQAKLYCPRCGTAYHENHIIDWFKNHDRCPICSGELSVFSKTAPLSSNKYMGFDSVIGSSNWSTAYIPVERLPSRSQRFRVMGDDSGGF